MTGIFSQSDNSRNKKLVERRSGDRRRFTQRRNPMPDGSYKDIERRSENPDRRITLFNRLSSEVTDRRALN
jgi:hypothetical protein